MERNQAALGGRASRVRERHVERRRLRHKLVVRRNHRSQARRVLQGNFRLQENRISQGNFVCNF